MVDGYERRASYVGRLEPARQTAVAFERAGLVISIDFDEGDVVRAGDAIARLDTAQLAASRNQLTAQRRALKAQRDLAQSTLRRQSRLKGQGWSPDQRYDEAKADADRIAADIERVTAQIAGIDIDIKKSTLRAPFAGTIAKRSIDDGTVIMAGAPVVNLLETSHRRARIGMPPNVAEKLNPDTPYRIRVNGQKGEAKLVSRRPDLQSGTRTVTALFDIRAASTAIPFGELVTLDLLTKVNERGAWVPLAALKEGRRGLWTILTIETTDGSQVVRPEAVELLYATAEQAYVRGTFKNGARVVSCGTGRVVAGQRVALATE